MLTTHILEVAERLADRIVELRDHLQSFGHGVDTLFTQGEAIEQCRFETGGSGGFDIKVVLSEKERIVKKSGIQEGFCLVSAMHITAGVYVNDHEEGLIADIESGKYMV